MDTSPEELEINPGFWGRAFPPLGLVYGWGWGWNLVRVGVGSKGGVGDLQGGRTYSLGQSIMLQNCLEGFDKTFFLQSTHNSESKRTHELKPRYRMTEDAKE